MSSSNQCIYTIFKFCFCSVLSSKKENEVETAYIINSLHFARSSSTSIELQRELKLSPLPAIHRPSLQITAMRQLTQPAATAARAWTRHSLPLRPATTAVTMQKRYRADGAPSASADADFESPWTRSGGTMRDTTQVPDFSKYRSAKEEITNRVFQYFMVGTMGALTAMGAKNTVQGMSL